MTVSVQGGVPPYQLIIIPVGTQNPEYRRIINLNITEGQTSMSFFLAYPKNTQFVALMNDATGVGTGGTGVATTVRMMHSLCSPPPLSSTARRRLIDIFGYARRQLKWNGQSLPATSCMATNDE